MEEKHATNAGISVAAIVGALILLCILRQLCHPRWCCPARWCPWFVNGEHCQARLDFVPYLHNLLLHVRQEK
jgi:hypothetical protein